MVSTTSARPNAGRPAVPAKMTSSILPPRSVLAPCSPITQLSASTTLDLPEPFGPTTQVIPGSKTMVVEEANDLKPRRVRLFRYIGYTAARCLLRTWLKVHSLFTTKLIGIVITIVNSCAQYSREARPAFSWNHGSGR